MRRLAGILIAGLALAGLSACDAAVEATVAAPLPGRQGVGEPLLTLRLRATSAAEPVAPRETVAQGEDLSAGRIAELLEGLPELPQAPPQPGFRQRDPSPPPPRAGDSLALPFPAAPEAPPAPSPPDALEVLRVAPFGEVEIAPHLSVTFSQPMVPLGAQDEVAEIVPVRVSPEPSGQWRWLGTRTLVFEPDGRFPMATDYVVSIDPGARSADGGELSAPASFAFSTPPLSVVQRLPREPSGLAPVIYLEFDQRIDPGELLAHMALEGRHAPALRLATEAEIAADEPAAALSERAREGHWIALVPSQPLARDREYGVRLARSAPSAEGPRLRGTDEMFSFRTYAPLRIVDQSCSGKRRCRPGEGWWVRFNNGLVTEKPALTIDPELPRARAEASGSRLQISDGRSQGRTHYRVTLPASLEDVYGQTLGSPRTLTFEVGAAEPRLTSAAGPIATLDPMAEPAFPIFTVNYERVAVRIARVEPRHWGDWLDWQRRLQREDDPGPLPGVIVSEQTVRIEGEPDRMVETKIDLAPHLPHATGQLVVWVEPVGTPENRRRSSRIATWVQATRIGLKAFYDQTELVVWASALADGASLGGVELDLLPLGPLPKGEQAGKTDASGMARIDLHSLAQAAHLLVARRGRDLAILPHGSSPWARDGWRGIRAGDSLRWYSFDDRGIYRPGESGRVKGWLRRFGSGKGGDISALGPEPSRLAWALIGARGNRLSEGKVELSALGGFDLRFFIPDDANLGAARLEFEPVGGGRQGQSHVHTLEVQEFRRPDFEVETRSGEAPLHVGDEARLEVEARYFAGGGLGDAPVRWNVATQAASFRPPRHEGYHFGRWRPWWVRFHPPQRPGPPEVLEGRTDAAGRHGLVIELGAMPEPQPVSVVATASIRNVDRQTWSSSETLLVHPADLYVGLRTPRSFVAGGEVVVLEGVVADLEGRRVPGIEVEVTLARERWQMGAKGAEPLQEPAGSCRIRSSNEPFACRFEPEAGGRYRLTAVLHDTAGRRNETELSVWVAGGEGPPSRGVELEAVELIPEKESYQPGETARFLLQAPFSPAQGLLTVQRSGIIHTERFELSGPSKTLEVPVGSHHIPNFTVQVDLVGAAARRDDQGEVIAGAPPRVAHARGELELQVPPFERALTVEAAPARSVMLPGSDGTIDVRVLDAGGRPVEGAEVAVIVVDEAVLALTDYALPDPLAFFYASRPSGVWEFDQREQVLLESPLALVVESSMLFPQSLAMSSAESAAGQPVADSARRRSGKRDAPVSMRSDFSALAAFVPKAITDGDGRAVVGLRLPDSLTRYRVMAVAAAGGRQFGRGESSLTARLPLMLRPSPPRFLQFGDRFELSLVLQNESDRERAVDVALRGQGIALVSDADARAVAGRRVVVPARGRREVRFSASAHEVGTARFQAVARSGADADAASFELPVYTPSSAEAFATYGSIEQGLVRQPVRAPRDVWPQFGGIEVETSSTQLQALTDAFLYLVEYPFDCTEQLASRILGIAALRDVSSAFGAAWIPSNAELEATVAKDLAALVSRQMHDGSIGLWRRGGNDWPYVSLHAAHAMARARAKGFAVDDQAFERSRRYAQRIENFLPASYGEAAKRGLRAYALYVLQQMGTADAKTARELLDEAGIEGLSLEAQGWIVPVLHEGGARSEVERIVRHWMNRVAESASDAHFAVGFGDGDHVLFHSDRRVDGVLLEALLRVAPENDLIPKLVSGLLGHRTKGRWANTQENVFVLLALDRYFHVYEGTTPDFVARFWLGDRFAGEHRFEGRTTERLGMDVPMSELATGGAPSLVIAKEGPGRLYYRMAMRYAPKSLDLVAAERGFAVRRSYEAVDDEGDVGRNEDGTWRIRAGARVRVRLALTTPMRRTHVALVDPLPAGLEALNPALAVVDASPGPPSPGAHRFWWRRWYEHQNLRDERVEAFTSLLAAGVYEYSYMARATTPGSFVVPPSRAEEMYHPETFGRSSTDRVVVVD